MYYVRERRRTQSDKDGGRRETSDDGTSQIRDGDFMMVPLRRRNKGYGDKSSPRTTKREPINIKRGEMREVVVFKKEGQVRSNGLN